MSRISELLKWDKEPVSQRVSLETMEAWGHAGQRKLGSQFEIGGYDQVYHDTHTHDHRRHIKVRGGVQRVLDPTRQRGKVSAVCPGLRWGELGGVDSSRAPLCESPLRTCHVC